MVDPAAEMRRWGLTTPGERARIVVISPHLDDAVLGCGRLLAAHPGATVITVYAGRPSVYPDPPTHWDALAGFAAGDDVLAARREEDRRALDELGAEPVWLDFVEHQYLPRSAWVGATDTADALEAAVRAARPTAVFAPFGLANPDHDAAHEAAMSVRTRVGEPSWFCYEDMGYKHIPGLLAWRVAKLFRAQVWPTPAVVPLDPSDDRRRAALAHYASQLRALEADWDVAAKLPAPEQHWRLAPPPTGWEALSAT
ncbi:MAG: PIG-L family deacetylase [Actinobacteria bacterium]|nr:PIG-L family deacetylase [Actinomycetota bacterium]